MSNVILKMCAYSNISYNNEYETGISIEEWAEMSKHDRDDVMVQAMWEDIEIVASDEEGTYLD